MKTFLLIVAVTVLPLVFVWLLWAFFDWFLGEDG